MLYMLKRFESRENDIEVHYISMIQGSLVAYFSNKDDLNLIT